MLAWFTRDGETCIDHFVVRRGAVVRWEPYLQQFFEVVGDIGEDVGAFKKYLEGRGWSYQQDSEIDGHATRYRWPEWSRKGEVLQASTEAEPLAKDQPMGDEIPF